MIASALILPLLIALSGAGPAWAMQPCEKSFSAIPSQGRSVPSITILAAVYLRSNRRTPELARALKQYKNTPESTNRTVFLDDRDLLKPASPEFIQAVSKIEHSRVEGAPTLYEERLFGLRKGDTVVFGTHQFKLGEFLGAGDATHIFAIDGEPGLALRIPFATSPGFTRIISYYRGGIGAAVRRDAQYPESVKRSHVRLADPENRFLVVDRVFGSLDGDAFFRGHAHPDGPEALRRFQELVAAVKRVAPYLHFTSEEELLVKQGRLPREWKGQIETLARQFLWDPRSREWVLVDLDLH